MAKHTLWTSQKSHIKVENESQIPATIYPHYLQMYNVPPAGYIPLEVLQEWCVNRLKVLKIVEKVSAQNYRKPSKQCVAILTEELERRGLYDFATLVKAHSCDSQMEAVQYMRRNDSISHFMLRSAFSFEHEKRQWFFHQEVKLFEWRFSCLDEKGIRTFNDVNGLVYIPISEEEKKEIMEDLEMSSPSINNMNNVAFYKVCFNRVMYLIARRQVFLKMGMAYVPETKICALVLSEFKKRLNKGFAYSREVASNAYGDERLTKIFTVLSNCVKIERPKLNEPERVSINELDELSRISYPLCMKVLHEALRENHHLTNGGRVQYGLYLKSIGLSLDDALQFWKDEFLKKMDETIFEKRYRYNFRHLYGQEGKRANYVPFNCFKIMNSTIGPRDNHGCPFKYMSTDVLKNLLAKSELVHSDIETVSEFSKKGCYLDACKRYYEITHNCLTNVFFEHPNLYFNESRKRLKKSPVEDAD